MKTRILLLSAVIALAACNNKKDPKAELADLKQQQSDIASKIAALETKTGKTDSVKSTDVSTIVVKASAFTNYVQLQGKVDAQDNVTAYPQAPGMITGLYVKPGDHVSKGQILAQLDNSVLKQQIAQAETQANLANTVFQRQKNLWDQKIGTEVQFLQAQATAQGAQKQVAALREQAALYRITSPIGGTIDQMDLKLGQAASPGVTGIRIVNADNLKVKADVPESYATRVNQGQEVLILFPDANDSLKTKVTFAAKVIDPASRSFGIEVKLPSTKTLRPNMTAILKIADYSKAKAIVVPLKVLQKSELGDYVFVNEGGIAKRRIVKTGATYNSQTEILSGLKEGEQLITMGAADIEEGDHVNVIQ
jgi:RND family efflux transporter MFP subunit